MDERLERHLCNLHNEVFEAAESRINTECSLTIREGISAVSSEHVTSQMFPHYTWGYIAVDKAGQGWLLVPSLYVRVYRKWRRISQEMEGSLTIREGISDAVINAFNQGEFPHYTWGYIGRTEQSAGDCEVPSLYVRVYRTGTPRMPSCSRSLTASEGISELRIRKSPSTSFPHCKWGYICGLATQWQLDAVPSLQVRVYRWHTNWPVFRAKFPHCKWGYIETARTRAREYRVPSLQVRVYRWFL